MNTMTYREYAARVAYSEEDRCFVGHIAGIRDVVGFHGESVSELRTAFEEAVDDYLETCARLGRAPQKPYSGKLMLRVDPVLHARAAMLAEAQGKSLNAWAEQALEHAVAATQG
jgi:predicted HicB family RNase H-like nuclease